MNRATASLENPGARKSISTPVKTSGAKVDSSMILTAMQLISIFESCALRLPGRSQQAIFKRKMHMPSSISLQKQGAAVLLYHLSSTRTVTEENKAVLRKALNKEGSDG